MTLFKLAEAYQIAVSMDDPTIERVLSLILRCAEQDAAAVMAARINDGVKFHAAVTEAQSGLRALDSATRMAVVAVGQLLLDQMTAAVASGADRKATP